ncbi:unnamed protein product [Arabis nemorensis]|uniref:Uncharacterized protein n=1 Tax=Arabis nemorensis TaxID=586526 RepID=A0A565C7G1_9BRAS|nr:unnamed protein product [Arabis nemorensis]
MEKIALAKAESESEKSNPSPASNANPSSSSIVYVRRRAELDSAKAATNKPTESSLGAPSSTTQKLLEDWEERYHHLQMLLNDSSHRTDHLRMLSSAELSKHAVDLEKRSIQFSLEEAREMQRVAALNVLGRSLLKSTSNDGQQQYQEDGYKL